VDTPAASFKDHEVTLSTIQLQVSLNGRHQNVTCHPPHPLAHRDMQATSASSTSTTTAMSTAHSSGTTNRMPLHIWLDYHVRTRCRPINHVTITSTYWKY